MLTDPLSSSAFGVDDRNGSPSALSRPLQLGGVTLPNRIVSAPMERNYCDAHGRITDVYIEYLDRRAEAGVGLIFTEATYVREDGKGRRWQLGAHHDECIPGLSLLARTLHARGALVGCELNHGGRTAQGVVSGHPTVAPSPVPCEVAGGEMPRVLSGTEVRELASDFGRAAARCAAAGIDVLSIHGGHGYLIHQFMSPLYNLRTDEFADPVAFLNLVIDEVRSAAPGLAIGLRFSSFEGSPGGLDVDATFAIIERARLDKLDFLDVSAGSYEAGEWTIQTGEFEPGFLSVIADRYRVLGLPLGMAGRINTPEAAEAAVLDGHCDFVSIGRALHADPAWASAALAGTDYRPCIACNVCIDGLANGPVGCTVNPAVGTGQVPVSMPALHRRSDVTVLGGGPAGMVAARELAAMGATVTLVERSPRLGGQLTWASRMRANPEFHRLRDWLVRELDRLEVSVILGTDYGDMQLRRRPSAIVDATGGAIPRPNVPGFDRTRVMDVRSWLAAEHEPPAFCTIWGADTVGLAVADTLAAAGSRILVIGQQPVFAPEAGRRTKILSVPRLLANPAVEIHLSASLLAIGDDTVTIFDTNGTVLKLPSPGPFLVSQGMLAREVTERDAAISEPAGAAHGGGPSTIRAAIADGTAAARAVLDRLNSESE